MEDLKSGGDCPDCLELGSIEKYIYEEGDIYFICTDNDCSFRVPAPKEYP